MPQHHGTVHTTAGPEVLTTRCKTQLAGWNNWKHPNITALYHCFITPLNIHLSRLIKHLDSGLDTPLYYQLLMLSLRSNPVFGCLRPSLLSPLVLSVMEFISWWDSCWVLSLQTCPPHPSPTIFITREDRQPPGITQPASQPASPGTTLERSSSSSAQTAPARPPPSLSGLLSSAEAGVEME